MPIDNADVLISGLTAVALYMFLSSLFQHKKVKFMHQTGVAIIIGFIIGMFAYFLFNPFFQRMVMVNDSLVFYGLLPPMLFADGYNLKKRRFFQNLYYINIYGLVGTVLHFLVFVGLLYAVSALGLIRDTTNFSNIRHLQTWQILLFSACMCSIDNIASLSQIKPQYQPKIFSIIFGESLFKDSITIVLYKSIERLINNNTDQFVFYWYTAFVILATFLVMILVSILIGFVFAILLTLVFKHARFLVRDQGVTEVGLIFLTGYISYLASELAGFSGVISMLFCGITLSHFNTYNMSATGTQAAKVTFETVALIAQGFLFLVLGIVSWQVQGDSDQGLIITQSVTFILCCFLILFLARFINIYLITWLFRPCKGHANWRVNSYQLQIIYASGLVKGAVPFALITSTSFFNNSHGNQVTNMMIKSTVIVLVFGTSVFFNSVLPMFIRNRKERMKEMVVEGHPSLVDSLIEKEREAMKQEGGESPESKRYKSQSQKYWKKFDQGILKPFLIYNYANRRSQIKQQKKKQRMQQIHIVFESQGDVKHNRGHSNVLDPLNEDRNVFVEVVKGQSDNSNWSEENRKSREEREEQKKKRIQKAKEKNKKKVTFQAEIPTRHAQSVADHHAVRNQEMFSSENQVESLYVKGVNPSPGTVSPPETKKMLNGEYKKDEDEQSKKFQ